MSRILVLPKNPHRKMGHGFVLAMMLETCPTFYKQYEVIN